MRRPMHVKVEVEKRDQSKRCRSTIATVSARGVQFVVYFFGQRYLTDAQEFAELVGREHASGADAIIALASAMKKCAASHTSGPVIDFALKCSQNDSG